MAKQPVREAVIREFPRYSITDDGQVISYVRETPRLLKSHQPKPDLMLRITLCEEPEPGSLRSNGYTRFIHKLVAEAFLPRPRGVQVVEHIDGDYHNNHYKNLRWITKSENVRKYTVKNRHGGALLTVKQVKEIKAAGAKSNAQTEREIILFREALAEKYGVSDSIIYSVLNGFTWSYV